MKTETEVIIVGAGPTGLSLACQLIRHGVDFVIVERNEGPTPYSKAMAVQARTLEIYEQMDLARTAVERGAVANTARLIEGGQVRGRLDLSEIGEGLSPYPFLLILEQSENEKLLNEYVREHGRNVEWQTTLKHVSQDGSGVTAEYTRADGSAGQVRGKYIVGCDGAKSRVREELGLTFEGSTFERIFYVADVKLDWDLGHDGFCVTLSRDAFVLFFPMKGEQRFRIIGVLPEGADQKEGDALYEEIERHVKEQSELQLDITEVNWFSSYKVHTRRVDHFSQGRGFVAGDAAHIHSPAGGQGMNTGIQDAYNLAWKLAYVLRGQAGPDLLDTYDEERSANAQRLLDTTDRLFQLAAGSDWFVSLIRTTIFPPLAGIALGLDPVRKLIFPLVSQIGITYRKCRLSDHSGDDDFAVKAGDRMPYLLLDGASIYDRLREPKFHLLTFSDGASDQVELVKRAGGEWAKGMDHHVLPLYPAIAEKFGSETTFHVLLRPDNHLSLIAAGDAASAIDSYLKNLGVPKSRSV